MNMKSTQAAALKNTPANRAAQCVAVLCSNSPQLPETLYKTVVILQHCCLYFNGCIYIGNKGINLPSSEHKPSVIGRLVEM